MRWLLIKVPFVDSRSRMSHRPSSAYTSACVRDTLSSNSATVPSWRPIRWTLVSFSS